MVDGRVHRDKRRWWSRIPAGSAVAVLVVLAAAAFVVAVAVTPAPVKESPPQQIPPVNVRAMVIRPLAGMVDDVLLPGVLDPNRVVGVAAEVAGRIERIPSREGRPCDANDKLVLLNTDLLKADYDLANATKEFDAREQKRVADLVSSGVATPTEADQARTKAAASAARLESAEARLRRAVIVAPIAGVLNRLAVEEGEYVSPGQLVAEIVEVDPMLVVVAVPEREMGYLRVGDTHEVRVDALGGEKATGTISYISETADAATRTTRVELTVANPLRRLRSGQIVTVQLKRRTLRNQILIPLAAVIPLEEGKRVYVVDNDGLGRPCEVKLGFFKSQQGRVLVQVLDGLSAGDVLIVENPRYVGPGQPVNVVGWIGDPPATRPATRPAAGSGGVREVRP